MNLYAKLVLTGFWLVVAGFSILAVGLVIPTYFQILSTAGAFVAGLGMALWTIPIFVGLSRIPVDLLRLGLKSAKAARKRIYRRRTMSSGRGLVPTSASSP